MSGPSSTLRGTGELELMVETFPTAAAGGQLLISGGLIMRVSRNGAGRG